jgi:integrase
MTMQYTVERFLEYVQTSRAKNTLTMYSQGLKKYTEWSGKTANEILQQRIKDWTSEDLFEKKRFSRELEKFHAYLIKDRNYSPNSATYYVQGLRALFAYYEMPVKLNSEIDKRKMTTKDYVPRIDQYREMFKVADNLRDKLIVSLGLTLAWRISDFAAIKKSDLPNLDSEPPIRFDKLTKKEQVIAKSFLSNEAVQLLKEYLPTLGENPYLFPSNGKGHLNHTTFNRILKDLAERANLKFPKGKRIRFHCFRKRFLSESANLRIDVNIAKLLVGKSVECAMLAYLGETDLRTAFERISERLRLTDKRASVNATDKKEAEELRKRLDQLERRQNLIAAINPDVVRRADEMLERLLQNRMRPEQWKMLPFGEKLDLIAKEQEKKEKEEYKKMHDT